MPGSNPSKPSLTLSAQACARAKEDNAQELADDRISALVEELVGALELFSDPPATWIVVKAEVERILMQKTAGAHQAEPQPDASGQTPGALNPIRSEAPMQDGRRPFAGFDAERAMYERLKPELLATAEGKFVVLVGDEMVGPKDTYGETLRAGYERFGAGPLYIKQVLAVEPVVEVFHNIVPCPP